jgi:hypothetical protein
MKEHNFYEIFDIMCKVIEQKLYKNQEISAIQYFNQNEDFIKKGLKMKEEDPTKYNEIFGEYELIEYYINKCYMIFQFAKKYNCFYFISKTKETIKSDPMYDSLREKLDEK